MKLIGYRLPPNKPASGDSSQGAADASKASATAAPPHPYLVDADAQVRRGQTVARALLALKQKGFVPDLAVAHPGWGESLFFKDIFPQVPLLGYFEYFFGRPGGDVGFDPEFPDSVDNQCRLRVRNAMYLSALDACDVGLTPTAWQHSRFPDVYQPRIEVLHEGVDTDALQPYAQARFAWKDQVFQAGEPIVTFVARGLEPYRGFHIFMRALPELLCRNPKARVIVVGGDAVSYGRNHPSGRSWREVLTEQAGPGLDLTRVTFTGKLSRQDLTRVLQVSAAHVYLTYPFVLSWSMLEAMSCGALVVGSRTSPVQELIEHGRNGLLVDFFDGKALVDAVSGALESPADFRALRQAARETIVSRYDLKRICLPQTLALLGRWAGQRAFAQPA
jgi:glycosyltransferase involved in cell wall biosynthesis